MYGYQTLKADDHGGRGDQATSFGVGASHAIREVERALGGLASAEVNLLLRGERGTGRRILARAIHAESQRSSRPLIEVALSSVAEARLEPELFGQPGAEGAFARAHGSTLYISDIELLSPRLQRRLVAALDTPDLRGDVRLVAATSVELDELVRLGRFRADLYFHLPVRVTIPPLRERPEDITLLANEFVRRWCTRMGVPPVTLGRPALNELAAYAWPGNAIELEQTLEAALKNARGGDLNAERIRAVLGRRPRRHAAPDVFPLRQLERDYIATVLSRCNWNQSLAARRLGIGRNTLLRKIKSFGLDRGAAIN
jgi:DNA-binding NtrC family response regulator